MKLRVARIFRPIALCLTFSLLNVSGAACAEEPSGERMRKILEEMEGIEREIDQLARRVPVCDAIEDEPNMRLWATQGVELETFDLKTVGAGERLRLADGQPAPFLMRRLEISGHDSYGKVYQFLVRLGLRFSRLIELDRLQVKAAAEGTVSYTARLALPCYKERDKVADPAWQSMEDSMVEDLSRLQGTRQLLQELTARSNPGRLVIALAAFEEASGVKAVALTNLRSAQEVVLEGVVRGALTRDSLRPALAKAGFQVARLDMSPDGICEKFSATARLEAREYTIEEMPITLGNGLFDDQTATACKPVPSLGRIMVRGAVPATKGNGLTLHLRDVDLMDVFSVLHDLTAENFVIDPALSGRVSMDVEEATVEEAFKALRAAGVAIGPGPLRQVYRAGSRPDAAAPPPGSYTGERIDVALRGADLGTFLCTCAQISPSRITASRQAQGRIYLFAKDLPWDQMIDGVATAVGLVAALDKERVFVGPAQSREADGVPACDLRTAEPTSRLDYIRTELGAGDLELAGVVHAGGAGEGWKAYAYSPTRYLRLLEPGGKLTDAEVKAVDSTGVTFATGASGEVRIPFQP